MTIFKGKDHPLSRPGDLPVGSSKLYPGGASWLEGSGWAVSGAALVYFQSGTNSDRDLKRREPGLMVTLPSNLNPDIRAPKIGYRAPFA